MKILITGVAGFIGYSIAKYYSRKNKIKIIGIDNFSKYSGKDIKNLRINILKKNKNFKFLKCDINNQNKIKTLFKKNKFEIVIHLAAEVGVRYSLIRPDKYMNSNVKGFFNIIDNLKYNPPRKFLFASSSSVYGESKIFPLKENQILSPKNIYALSKKNNEEIAEIYSNKYPTQFLALRFFTVFGELGRPDMFFYKSLNSIFNKKKLYLNNSGDHYRDFTYIKDVVKIIHNLITANLKDNFYTLNICSSKPIYLKTFIKIIERYSKKINLFNAPAHPADVYKTHGSNKKLLSIIKKIKFTNIEDAVKNSVKSYKKYKIFNQKN